jgi:hypothetical protein
MKCDRACWLVLLPLLLRAQACRDFDAPRETFSTAAGNDSVHFAEDAGGAATTGAHSSAGAESAGIGVAGGGGVPGLVGPEAEAGAGGVPTTLPPLEPSAFPGLALWLEASPEVCSSRGEGGAPATIPAKNLERVVSWRDASSHDNHARALDPAHEPLFVLDALNGHAALRFDREPSVLTIADSDSIRFGEGPFAILMVMRWSNAVESLPPEYNGGIAYDGSGAVLRKVGLYQPFDGIAIFANFPGPFPQRPAVPRLAVQLQYANAIFFSHSSRLNDNTYRLYVVRRPTAGVGLIRVNGQSDGRAQIPSELDVSGNGQPLTIGGWETVPFRGELAEFIAIGGAVEDNELGRLERHLIEKYALLPAAE